MTNSSQSSGSGPGVITPDGCAVEFYARMTARDEPAIVHQATRPGARILELGCGAGRVTHPLVALGHPVVAVDESPDMLAHVHGAETVRARIEELALGCRFDVVLLASHLINADPATRTAFLAACRRHVADDGCVIIEQHPPEYVAGEQRWTQSFVATQLKDDELVTALGEAGLQLDRYLTEDRRWLRAVPG